MEAQGGRDLSAVSVVLPLCLPELADKGKGLQM